MLTDLGFIALVLAFLLSVYGTIASAYGGWGKRTAWVETARNASLLVFPLLTLSVMVIVVALYKLDFSLAYVADVSSRAMSPFLRITALWGGQQGSILFWAWLMAGFVGAVLVRKWDQDRELMPFFIFVAMLTTTFFVGVTVFITNPFARLWHIVGDTQLTTAIFQPPNSMPYLPQDGSGLNPLLRHFGMIDHPPTTYLGFTGLGSLWLLVRGWDTLKTEHERKGYRKKNISTFEGSCFRRPNPCFTEKQPPYKEKIYAKIFLTPGSNPVFELMAGGVCK